jgi:hypothetical protein
MHKSMKEKQDYIGWAVLCPLCARSGHYPHFTRPTREDLPWWAQGERLVAWEIRLESNGYHWYPVLGRGQLRYWAEYEGTFEPRCACCNSLLV